MANCGPGCTCTGKKWAIAILVILVVFLIAYIVWKGYVMLAISREVAVLSLNGYWHIANNRYMLITGSIIKILDIVPTPDDKFNAVDVFSTKNAKIEVDTTNAVAHTFVVNTYTADVDKIGISGPITMIIAPSVGIMRLMNVAAKIDEKLVKDNEMSNQR